MVGWDGHINGTSTWETSVRVTNIMPPDQPFMKYPFEHHLKESCNVKQVSGRSHSARFTDRPLRLRAWPARRRWGVVPIWWCPFSTTLRPTILGLSKCELESYLKLWLNHNHQVIPRIGFMVCPILIRWN